MTFITFLQSLAVAKLKEKGGVQKEDPNAVRKKLMSPEQKEKIRKRVAEDQGKSHENSVEQIRRVFGDN